MCRFFLIAHFCASPILYCSYLIKALKYVHTFKICKITFWIIVVGQEEKVTDKVIDMGHESLRPPNDKLIDASNRMTPDLRAGVFEKLQELWN